MPKLLVLLLVLALPAGLVAAEPEKKVPEKKPEFTEAQLDKLKTAEEKYKDNPAVMKLIQNLKEKSGLTEDTAKKDAGPPPEPPPPAFEGSADTADEAYKSRDYGTAFKHYQALAAKGDPEATLKLGTMYEMGYGTEKDPAAAHAWYKKAADAGDNRGKTFSKAIANSSMSDEDLKKSDTVYTEISKPAEEQSQGAAAGTPVDGKDADQAREIKFSVIRPESTGIKSRPVQDTRVVKFTPEKINTTQHAKLSTGKDSLQVEKFTRSTHTSDTGE